jgi:hypothetical protein
MASIELWHSTKYSILLAILCLLHGRFKIGHGTCHRHIPSPGSSDDMAETRLPHLRSTSGNMLSLLLAIEKACHDCRYHSIAQRRNHTAMLASRDQILYNRPVASDISAPLQ